MGIMPSWSSDGICYFAKNSDRSPNEPLLTLRIRAADHEPGSVLHCTYIDIEQVAHTHEIIISKPSWMWGAEMGVNDARVAIGNEAVFTRSQRGKPALIGMDLLRLALERAGTAEAAVEVMIELLEQYGQGGDCGFDSEFHYDNSFLVCDPTVGYVLETSAKNYAVSKITDRYAISNRLSIGTDHIMEKGIAPGEDFTRRFLEPVRSFFAKGTQRRCLSMEGLTSNSGVPGLFDILRTHAPGFNGHEFSRPSVGSVCMHAGGMIGDQTTGSMVAKLCPDRPITIWMTGASTPCISAFKPVFWHTDSPPLFEDPSQSFEYWLKREHLHRAVIAGKVDVSVLRDKVKELEARWLAEEERIMSAEVPDEGELAALATQANAQEREMIDEFSVTDWQIPRYSGRYANYWIKKNEKLGLERG